MSGANDNEAAVWVGLKVLQLPWLKGWPGGNSGERLHEGRGRADNEAAIAFQEGKGENVEIFQRGCVDDAGRAIWQFSELGGDVSGAKIWREREIECRADLVISRRDSLADRSVRMGRRYLWRRR